jgi:hypothetical protein
MRACCYAFSEEMVSISAASDDMPCTRALAARSIGGSACFSQKRSPRRCCSVQFLRGPPTLTPPDNGPLARIAHSAIQAQQTCKKKEPKNNNQSTTSSQHR